MTGVNGVDVFAKLLARMSPEEAVRWLASPHPMLDGRTPEALMAEGLKARVLTLIDGNEPCGETSGGA